MSLLCFQAHSTEFSDLVSWEPLTHVGTATAQVLPQQQLPTGDYWDIAHYDYAGTLHIYFNQTQALAAKPISVGFLDSTNISQRSNSN